jgi:hypothetical protein
VSHSLDMQVALGRLSTCKDVVHVKGNKVNRSRYSGLLLSQYRLRFDIYCHQEETNGRCLIIKDTALAD